MSERAYFNSSVPKEDYAVVKDEAYRLGITVKQHISNIICTYVRQSREEDQSLTKRADVNKP